MPGSHRNRDVLSDETAASSIAVTTVPGDVIVIDEHLLHSSHGGEVRHQWRVDYVARPTGPDDYAIVQEYFAAMFSPDWDGGYDVDAYPTYGPHWRSTAPPTDDALLDAVGAYAAATEEEQAAARRRVPNYADPPALP